MRFCFGAAIWLFAVCTPSGAQVLTVSDAGTGLPLERVSVYAPDRRLQGFTNADGQIDLTPFAGAGRFDIARVGFRNRDLTRADLEAAGWQVALEPTPLTMDQVVVSASRWMQERHEVSQRVVTLTPARVQLANPQTAADLLGLSGELYVQKSQQAGGSPMIRGFSTNRLLYAVDGVRMNTAIFRSGNLQQVISLDPFVMEQTEVLFGPGSILYGSDAIGGVMSFQTLTPHYALEDDVTVREQVSVRTASANRERTAHAHAEISGRRLAGIISVTQSEYGDLRMGRHGPDAYLRPVYAVRENGADAVRANPDPLVQVPTGYSQINLMQKIRYRAGPKLDLQAASHFSTTGSYSRYDRLTRMRNGTLRSGAFGYGPQVWAMNQVSATHTGRGGWYDDAVYRISHQFFEESRFDRDLNSPTRRDRMEKVIAYAASADFRRFLGEHRTLFYGAEAVTNDVRSRGEDVHIETGSVTTGPSRYPQAVWRSLAAYARYQHEWNRTVNVTAGLRLNRFALEADFTRNQAFFPLPFQTASLQKTALTGSAGLVWRPDRRTTLSLTGSTGFRAPNVDDMGKIFDSTPGSVVVPNTDLRPEYAWNGEIGAARQFGEVVKADLTAFYSRLNRALVRRPFLLNGEDSVMYHGERSRVEALQNAAFATVYGIQGGVEAALAPGLSAAVSGAWQEGTEVLDNGSRAPLRHAAPLSLTGRLEYRFGRATLQLRALHAAAVPFRRLPDEERAKPWLYAADGNGNPFTPDWTVFNLHTLVQLSSRWKISTGIENLTDRRYRPYSSGLTAPGRNFQLAIHATM